MMAKCFVVHLLLILLIFGLNCDDEDIIEFTIQEEQPEGIIVGRINEPFTSVEQRKYENVFLVNPKNGYIITTKLIDRETLSNDIIKNGYRFKIILDKTKIITIIVHITDINDNIPEFPTAKLELSLSESTLINSDIKIRPAKDIDSPSNAVTLYKIETGDINNNFVINTKSENSLYLRLIKSLDFEEETELFLKISACDIGLRKCDYTNVHIIIIDENDNKPEFEQDIFFVSIYENVTFSDQVFQIQATDADSGDFGQVTYSLADINDKFGINYFNGQIFIQNLVDAEKRASYLLIPIASDKGKPPLRTSCKISVTILDCNDNRPNINVLFFMEADFHVVENEIIDTQIANVTVWDKDKDKKNNQVELFLYPGNNLYFYLKPIKHLIYGIYVKQAVDREEIQSILIQLQARDNGNPSLSTTIDITMKVKDANDNYPVFKESNHNVEILESTNIGHTLLQLQATDKDIGSNGDITYSIYPPNTWFTVNQTTGLISLIKTIDREEIPSLTFNIKAEDNGDPRHEAYGAVYVSVLDVNDNDPMFPLKTITYKITENNKPGVVIGTLKAYDADIIGSEQLVYSFQGSSPHFNVNKLNGEITAVISFDREKQSEYKFTLIATDGGGRNGSIEITVQIIDMNDYLPRFESSSYNLTIHENFPILHEAARITAIDLDEGDSASMRYSGINLGRTFSIDQNSGAIILNRKLKIKRQNVYKFTILVYPKNGKIEQNNSANVQINIIPANDKPLEFEQPQYHFKMNENNELNHFVGSVQARRANSGSETFIRYEIVRGKRYDVVKEKVFSIDGNGDIRAEKLIDYESRNLFKIRISATDTLDKRPRTLITVFIRIIDENDNKPRFVMPNNYLRVSEGVAIGHVVYTFKAIDLDSEENGKVTYRIVNKTVPFNVTKTTGQIITSGSLDYEEVKSFDILLEASDNGSPSISSAIMIHIEVEDVNDNPPTFTQPSYQVHVKENTKSGTSILKLHAYDADSLKNGEFTFYMDQKYDYEELLLLNGELILRKELDREVKSTYLISVRVRDKGAQPRETETMITIIVDDINDQAPVFQYPSYTFEILEEMPPAEIAEVFASDADSGDNALFTYSLLNENDKFKVESRQYPHKSEYKFSCLILSTRSFDAELDEAVYYLKINTTDYGTPKLTSQTIVTVKIKNINDEAPKFSRDLPYLGCVLNGTPKNNFITKIIATDADVEKLSIQYQFINLDSSIENSVDYFYIGKSNGTVYTKTLINTERKLFELIVAVHEKSDNISLCNIQKLIIFVVPNVPRKFFRRNCVQLALNENQTPINIPISRLLQQDYSYTVGNYTLIEYKHNPFRIHSSTGLLQTKKQLNHKFQPFHQLVVTADGYKDRRSKVIYTDQVVVNIYVIPTNRFAPFYPSNPETFTVLENHQSMVKIGSFKAPIDSDTGLEGLCMYSIIETSQLDLSIRIIPPWSRDVYLVKPLDREKIKQYDLKVRVTDFAVDMKQRLSNTFTLNLIVQDVNDNAPMFKSGSYMQISEYQAVGSTVFNVIAEDPDVGETHTDISYHIISGNSRETFKLNDVTGVLTTNRLLNIFEQQHYNLTIMAKELRHPKSLPNIISLNSTYVLTIRVIDVNDKIPKFEKAVYYTSIKEGLPIDTFILQLNSTDDDYKDEYKYVQYKLTDHTELFSLDETTGVVTSLQIFDREVDQSFVVNAVVRNTALPYGIDHCKINIMIEDVNDHPPVFSDGNNIEIKIRENSAPDIIHTFVVTDHDFGSNAQSLFTLNINKGSKKFAINSTTGDLYMLKKLDRERRDRYEFTVEAQNIKPPYLKSIQNVTLVLLDENDEKPVFSKKLYESYINEAHTQKSVVLKVIAVDKDKGTNALIMYSIVKESKTNTSKYFEINADSGEIFSIAPVDYEKQREYRFKVKASGVGTESYDIANVVIKIIDSNDNEPVFGKSVYEVTLHTIQLLMLVVKVEASDKDNKGEQKLLYYIEPLNDYFEINSKTGEIRLMKTDIMLGQYHLNVKATDQGAPPLIGFTKVFITIGNPNAAFLRFLNSSVVFTISENPSSNTKLGKFVATSTKKGEIIYSLTESTNPHNAFRIGKTSGELYIANHTVIDYEVFPDFLLGVIASISTSEGYMSTHLAVVVNITDINDNVPIILPYRDKFIYTEQEINGPTYFLLYHVYDADAIDQGKLKIEIISGNEDEVFKILLNTFYMYIDKPIDYEKYKEFNLVVQVTDGGNPVHRNQSYLQVIVRDINDNPPVFNNLLPLNISEATLPGTIIKNITVNDVDTNSFQRYYLVPSSNSLFHIDTYSGALVLKESLDFEEGSSYYLNISVYDGSFKIFGELRINVLDANDNSPMFTKHNYIIPIKSTLVRNTYITQIEATDTDKGLNGHVQYKIHPPSDAFSIEQDTGIIFVNKNKIFPSEIDFYPLGVVAYDSGLIPRHSTITLQLSINGVKNTFLPEFMKRFYDVSVNEGANIGAPLETVLAYFPRSRQRSMYYRIAQGNINDAFAVHSTTGLVTINNVLDRELIDAYALEIWADTRELNMSAKCTMLIEIQDANDNEPVFAEHSYNISVLEGLPPGSHLINLKATDADDPKTKNGQVVYEIHSGQDEYEWLSIDRRTGEVTVEKALDREVRSRIQLTIKAADFDGSGQSDFASLNVTILDINDNTPQFNVEVPNIYDLEVPENQPSGTIVFKAQAIDPDEGPNGRISFQIVNSSTSTTFYMKDKDSGWVYTSVPLDYERIALYNLTIVAQDHGKPERSASFEYSIAVKDVNEYPPKFLLRQYNFAIFASAPVHSSVGALSATDQDGGAAGMIRFTFSSVITEFYMNEVTGVIMVKNDLRRREAVRFRRNVQKINDDISEFRYVAKADNFDNTTFFEFVDVVVKVNYSCPNCILMTTAPLDSPGSFNPSTTIIVIASIGVCFSILVLACCFIYCRRKKTWLQKHKKPHQRYFTDTTEIIGDTSMMEREYLTNAPTPMERIQNRMYNGFAGTDSIQDSSETDLIQESSGGTGRSVSVTDKASTFSFGIYHEQGVPDSQHRPFNDALSDMSIKDLEQNSVFGYPIIKKPRKAPSCISRSTQESSLYSIPASCRMPPANNKNKTVMKRNRAVSHESLNDFQEEGGGEAAGGIDVGNLLYAKLADVDADEEEVVMDGVRPFQEEGGLSHLGSLSTIMCDEDELDTSYSYNYSDGGWNNKFSEMSPLFMKHRPNSKLQNNPQNTNQRYQKHPPNKHKNEIPLGILDNSRTIPPRTSLGLNNHEHQNVVYSGALSPNFTPLVAPVSIRTPSINSLGNNKSNFMHGASPAKASFELGYPGMLERSDSVASQLSKITLSDINISDEEEDQL